HFPSPTGNRERENKNALEDKCNALRSVKATVEAKVKQLKEKAHNLEEFYEQRKVPTKNVSSQHMHRVLTDKK
ncbi:Hypothetical predicted protein, partial [Lynx pardinus]